ncbi:MAG: hypothetical protein J5U17_00755 [Candidatus Methanoperedens sp.]|nr:hypothetical protein [Candidatus Methanoperedens sp.]MCE8424291.1 hypothetical protein [Candidatus Methanoperedens sp.]MCE8426839.1 hypothetical protein [Candidatus Methanoperedens sp.]
MAINEPKNIGDEFIEETEEMAKEQDNPKAGLYDLVLPPGVPQKVIVEAMEKFNLEVATRKCDLKTIEVDTENLLVLRGELNEVNNAHDYIYQKMSEKYNYKRQI